MGVNAWGRGRSRTGRIHVRKPGSKRPNAETLCGRSSDRTVGPEHAAVADCKRCKARLEPTP